MIQPLLFAALLALTTTNARGAQQDCRVDLATKRWIERAFADWSVTAAKMKFGQRPDVWGVFFDERCVHHVRPDAATLKTLTAATTTRATIRIEAKRVSVRSFLHDGTVRLPDEGEVPPRLITFASTYGHDDAPFIVMALPSLWRADARHKDKENLDTLIRGVFMHEMTHTAHTPYIGSIVGQVERDHPHLELDDDIVQKTFSSDPAFTAAYELERDLLYQAVGAAPSQRPALIRQVREAVGARRARFFVGDRKYLETLEDVFLVMEGAGNLAAVKQVQAEGASREEAVKAIRGNGRWWTQEEGLALFLLLEATTPDWQRLVFTSKPATVLQLLAAASGE